MAVEQDRRLLQATLGDPEPSKSQYRVQAQPSMPSLE